MNTPKKMKIWFVLLVATILLLGTAGAAFAGGGQEEASQGSSAQGSRSMPEGDVIKIGLLAPTTGGLAQSGADAVNGFMLFWELNGFEAGGRPIEVIVADTAANPDQGINQARRLINSEGVNLLVGPLAGHVGLPVAQVSAETGVPVLMSPSAPDNLTKWDRVPTVVRTSFSASQEAHALGEFIYEELGWRNVAFIGQDYTYGQEKTLGAAATFELKGGRVAQFIWAPLGTTDYGPLLASIPANADGVVATVVGADRLRLYEQWFDFGYDRRYEIVGNSWMQVDALRQMDDRAIGMWSAAIHYAQGIDNEANTLFIREYIDAYGVVPSYFAESTYTTAMWAKAALDRIDGDIEDVEAFINAMMETEIDSPRGTIRMDDYGNPIHNAYITKVAKVNYPGVGDALINDPVVVYEDVSQFWTWSPEEFMARGPYVRK